MKHTLLLLMIASAVGAGCRSLSPVTAPSADAPPPQTPAAAVADDNVNLPGIGDAPDVVPSTAPMAVRDPFEPVNRAFFRFNDKLYYWVLKPVARGYARVVPLSGRRGVKNFFANIAVPARFVNCALQAEFKDAGREIARFAINTTVGVAGFSDPAKRYWHLEPGNEDLGQTLGRYGVGPSIYVNWPVFGPSCLRDTVGSVGDGFLDPIDYLVPSPPCNVGVKSYGTINGTSLRADEYEAFKEAAIDPYIALRDAYYQYRRHLVANAATDGERPPGPLPQE